MDTNQWFYGLDKGCLIRGVLRKIWMVLLAAVIAAGTMNLALITTWEPVYRSSATYAVMSKSGLSTTLSNMASANEAATMMSEILQSEVMTNRIREELGSGAPMGSLSATVVGDTNMLVITADAKTSESAFRLMQIAMESFDEYFSKVDSTAVLQKISDARVPLSPQNSQNTLNKLVFAAAVGAVAMTALLIYLHVKADTIQTRRGARKKLDAQVLVTLPHEKNAPLMVSGGGSFYFRENLYRLRSRIESAASKSEDATVILVTSVAANEGKSTVAANLALALAEKHRGVLLLDADLRNPSLLGMLGEKYGKEKGLGHLLSQNRLSVDEITNTVAYQKETNLMTILERHPHSGATDMLSGQHMAKLLTVLRKTVKYIVLDAPPIGIFPDGSVLSDLADISVLVVRQDMASACDINDAVDMLGQGKSDFMGCILNDMRSYASSGYGYGYGYSHGYGYGHRYGYGYGADSEKDGTLRGDGKYE